LVEVGIDGRIIFKGVRQRVDLTRLNKGRDQIDNVYLRPTKYSEFLV